MKEENKKNIFQRMLEATDKINKVAKNLSVGVGSNTYKAVGEADVLAAVKPIEIECGIYSYPVSRKIIETNVLTTTSEYNGKVTEKNQLFMRLEVVYRFVNIDNPEEYIDIVTYGDGVDTQDKAPGKAMTYADKYALLKAYKIETGEDPDKDASEELKTTKPAVKKISPKQIELIEKLVRDIPAMLKHYEVEKIEDLSISQASEIIKLKTDNK